MFVSLNFNIIFNSSRTNITLKHYSILILCTTFVTKRIYIIGKRKILYHDTKNVENYLVSKIHYFRYSNWFLSHFIDCPSLSLVFTNDSSFTLPATHILSLSRFYCFPTPIYTRTKIPPRSLSKVFIIVVNNSWRKPAFHRLQRVYLAYKNV